MLTLGFYFLLRLGEYAHTANPNSTPFRFQDIHLHSGQQQISHLLSTPTIRFRNICLFIVHQSKERCPGGVNWAWPFGQSGFLSRSSLR
jgi:hypothetical protein